MPITTDDYHVQVELASVTNVAKDSVVNSFAVKAMSGAASFGDINVCVDQFYNNIATILGPTLNSGANKHITRVYHLIEPEPRPPVYVGTFTQAGTGAPLPAEVALCSSFQGLPQAGVRQSRRRGRLYIGPLNTASAILDSGYSRPSGATITTLATATKNFRDQLIANNWELCVWSRKNNTLVPVNNGWVNNEWDTQRRRGPEVSSRVTW